MMHSETVGSTMTAHKPPSFATGRPHRRLAYVLLAVTATVAVLAWQSPPSAGAPPTPDGERLTSRPRSAAVAAPAVKVGEEIQTRFGQRRRLALPDGSLLYVNQNTTAKLDAARELTLSAGEVLVEAAPEAREQEAALVVRTPKRTVSGHRAAFAVRAEDAGTAVLVTRGQVKVSGLEKAVSAGEQLPPDSDKPAHAPRVTHALGWTRDLLAAAESPLVPASRHAGGALIAVDPNGQEAKLSLRKYHVDVHIEDGFARTTIDQTYFNHENARLEGTFYFPLPADASLSRLAMYVDGNLMEGGMAERDYARAVYETILAQQRDPALLEWLDGTTFKMRVFPLEPRQEKRILLSYTQKLPALYDRLSYRFPAGHSLESVRQWSFHARVKDGANLSWGSDSHRLKATKEGSDLLLDAAEKDARVNRDVVLFLNEAGAAAADVARFSSAEQEGAKYLMLRFRPALTGKPQPQRRDWVFLVETSGDRDPLLARTQIDVMQGLLRHAQPDDTFAVLTAATRVVTLEKELRPVTPEKVQVAVSFLEKAHLIGALDLGQALNAAEPLLKGGRNPYLVHLGSGIAAMGERRDDVLARRIPEGVRYVGVGMGKRWNRSFMKAAAERSGGHFTQINPDEPISWRAFDLAATLNTPRLLNVQVTANADAPLLTFTSTVAQGEELCAVTRTAKTDTLPESVTVRGLLDDQPFERVLAVKDVAAKADYLPRTWAKLEIERLLAEDAAKHKEKIVELSKAMYVMTPFTSLLVLENEEMYQQFQVDRGRKDHWALYPAPQKIPVVSEPDPDHPVVGKGAPKTPKQVLETVLARTAPRLLSEAQGKDDGRTPVMAPIIEGFAVPAPRPLPAPPAPSPNRRIAELLNKSEDLRQIEYEWERIWFNDRPSHLTPERVPTRSTPDRGLRIVGAESLEPVTIHGKRPTPPEQTSSGVIVNSIEYRSPPDRRLRAAAMDGFAGGFPGEPDRVLAPVERVMGAMRLGRTGTPDIQEQIQELLPQGNRDDSLLYQRPGFSGDDRLFSDLVSYCPGMNSSDADALAVLDAETAPGRHNRPGQIDPGAKRLLDAARSVGWQSLTLEASAQPQAASAVTIFFNGSGSFADERTLPLGLRERVVCDGQTLLHLYPDLGIGARRTASRFHHADFARLVPWMLPSPEDLARGADVKLLDERTIVITPHGADELEVVPPHFVGPPSPVSYIRTYLVFGEDGRLTGRRFVLMPEDKTLLREVYDADGVVRGFDGQDKEVFVRKGKLAPAQAPDLKPDTKKLVVLPLPYRSRDHVLDTLKIRDKSYNTLRFEDGLALFASDVASGNNDGLEVFRRCFHERNQRQIGFYVLLAAAGQNLDAEHVDVLAEHLDEPLAQYLALYTSPVLRKHASQWAVGTGQWKEGFLRHLALSHALYQRWQNDQAGKADPPALKTERERAFEYVRRNKGSLFGWALLCLLQDRAGKDRDFHAALADLWPLFEDVPGLKYAARYEQARSLFHAGKATEARKRFRDLYEQTLAGDVLQAIDADFRSALLGDGDNHAWSDLLQKTADRFLGKKQRPAILVLARQVWQLGDESRANHLWGLATGGIADEKERLAMTLAGFDFLWETGQLAQADAVLQKLLDDKLARRPELWRLAAQLAERRGLKARELECLERALDAEYRDLPEVINLEAVRRDYRRLLEHYQTLADSMVALKLTPPPDFLPKVVRVADRWRSLDREGVAACQPAADILQALGERDLGWDYLTTPIGLRPNEAGPWRELAQSLVRRGDFDLADRAYKAAFEAEPTDAQLLWDRGENLRRAGKAAESQAVFRQLADGSWQPRFRWLQQQARDLAGQR
jgi:tetratricopeptide (TPR) repeat protein